MKVLVLAEASGGVTRHVVDLCRGLAVENIDVHLLYSPLRLDVLFESDLLALQEIGVHTVPVQMKRSPGLSDIFMLIQISTYIKKNGPFDVIHGHSSKAGALARLLITEKRTSKLYTPHAFITMNPELKRREFYCYSTLEWLLSYLGDGVIATSKQEHDHAGKTLRVSSQKLFFIPNGISIKENEPFDKDSFRLSLGIQQHKIVIGCIARFVPQKALEVLFQAFTIALQSNKHLHLVIIGDGPLKRGLEMEVEKYRMNDHVLLPGYADCSKFLPIFDIYAMTSRYEGFPYVLLDAMASSLPVLTTPFGGTELLVRDGFNGFVVPHNSPQRMSDAILSVAICEEKRNAMGVASRQLVKEYTASRMVAETIKVYNHVIAGKQIKRF